MALTGRPDGAGAGGGPVGPLAVLGDTTLQSRTLESVAAARRYHAWLTELARPWLGTHPMELGSGSGTTPTRGCGAVCHGSP